jgi:hypothetical protein
MAAGFSRADGPVAERDGEICTVRRPVHAKRGQKPPRCGRGMPPGGLIRGPGHAAARVRAVTRRARYCRHVRWCSHGTALIWIKGSGLSLCSTSEHDARGRASPGCRGTRDRPLPAAECIRQSHGIQCSRSAWTASAACAAWARLATGAGNRRRGMTARADREGAFASGRPCPAAMTVGGGGGTVECQ